MTFGNTTPILRIFDEAKAKEFYCDFLGFAVDWEHRFEENFPLYLQVSKDACRIHLSEHHGDCSPGAALRIGVEDIEAIKQELLDKDYKFSKLGIDETLWNTKEMCIVDPFGNRLNFVQAK